MSAEQNRQGASQPGPQSPGSQVEQSGQQDQASTGIDQQGGQRSPDRQDATDRKQTDLDEEGLEAE